MIKAENTNIIAEPLERIGIIGGGQLGKMLAQSAKRMGHHVIILDPTPACPAAQVSDQQIIAPYENEAALKKLNDQCDVITFEFENMPVKALARCLDPDKFVQGTKALTISQDRTLEKQYLNNLSLKTAPWQAAHSAAELDAAISAIGLPAILKTNRLGYDGKGQMTLDKDSDRLAADLLVAKQACVLEGMINFTYEASIMVARNKRGQIVSLPVSENKHRHNILHASIVPGQVSLDIQRRMMLEAKRLITALDYVGILGIEYFVCGSDLYINEIAPRPHNSGHYSIEACDFSQFDLHILAILNRPLPKVVRLHQGALMINVLGQHLSGMRQLSQNPNFAHCAYHDYGKTEPKFNRKMGHITHLSDEPALALGQFHQTGIWEK